MNNVGTYNQQDVNLKRVYFTGVSLIQAGQPFCYQQDPTTTTASTAPQGFSAATKGFPFDVTLPNSNNVRVFAGIVAETSVGKTGPCYIDIIVPRPGDILQVAVNQSASIAAGDLLQLDVTVGTQVSSAGYGSVALSLFGGFDAFAFASSTALNASALATALKIHPLVRALASIPSVDTSTSSRALVWVKFQ